MPLRFVEDSSRSVYCISLERLRKNTSFDVSEGGRKLNDPFDPYESLSAFTLRSVQFTDRILQPRLMSVWGAESLTIRSIRTDRYVFLCSVEYRSRIVYCISLGGLRKNTSFDVSVGGRKLNDPFDPYGSLRVLTFRRIQITDRILYLIRES